MKKDEYCLKFLKKSIGKLPIKQLNALVYLSSLSSQLETGLTPWTPCVGRDSHIKEMGGLVVPFKG